MDGVFISYSWKDKAAANLLAHALATDPSNPRIEIDRRLGPGSPDRLIPEALRRCSTVLLVLSEHSRSSPWVNQELGFALSHRKRIVLVPLDASAEPPGILATGAHRMVSLDWKDLQESINRCLRAIAPGRSRTKAKEELLLGRLERTERIAAALDAEREERGEIFVNAAFTIFGRPPTEKLHEEGTYSKRYEEALDAEETALTAFLDTPGCTAWFLLWPPRATWSPVYLDEMYANLSAWLGELNNAKATVHIACAGNNLPNRHVFTKTRKVFDGFKRSPDAGFERTDVSSHKDDVAHAANEIRARIERAQYRSLPDVERRVTRLWAVPCPGASSRDSS